MSTVPEIVVARHSGIRVLAFSLVTNKAVLESGVRGDDEKIQGMSEVELREYLSMGMANHAEVLEAGKAAAEDMQVSLLLQKPNVELDRSWLVETCKGNTGANVCGINHFDPWFPHLSIK